MSNDRDFKYVFEYDPNEGVALADNQVPGYVEMIISAAIATGKGHFLIGGLLTIDHIRLSVLQGKIPFANCAIKHLGILYPFNEYGTIQDLTSSFWAAENVVAKIMLLQAAKRNTKNFKPEMYQSDI